MDILRASFIAVVVISQTVRAFPPYPYDLYVPGTNGSVGVDVPILPLKFQEWYPELEDALRGASTTSCQLSLQAYLGNMTARIELKKVGYHHNYCSLHNDCILGTVYQSAVAHMAAASMLLDLTPTILASLGPTISEISLLSSQRPFLSLLLAMGAPATFPSRFLSYSDPLQLLHRSSGLGLRKIRQIPTSWAAVLSLFQYIVAGIAIWNIIATSRQLGSWTVISWQCDNSWFSLFWSLTPIAIHAPAVLGFRLYRRRSKGIRLHRGTQSDDSREAKESFLQVMFRNLSRIWRNETIISAKIDSLVVPEELAEAGGWVIWIQALATLFSLLQIVLGTAIFSSLLYIGIEDAALLFLRYAISAVACRIIIYIEVGGLAGATQGGKAG
ncbi:hypothetical protein BKA65DRAFT_410945 [Rhexocercosporidium sp. MPI-PUGE-AT-0058]|nr:hypothetical protein BKA65DRAFT_410945 [Rhexocercosporidium sp. MPI-PUGE-AT-0058]